MLTITTTTITPSAETIYTMSFGSKEKEAFEGIIHKLGKEAWNMDVDNTLETDEHLLLETFFRRFEQINNT